MQELIYMILRKVQEVNIYHNAVVDNLDAALSQERFNRYMDLANDDKEEAFKLYAFNMRISESFYTPIHMLEVTLRNRFHGVLSHAYGVDWVDHSAITFGEVQLEQIARVKNDIVRDRKQVDAGRIVAGLTFGFWTSLLSSEFETLWQQVLHKAAAKPNGKGLTRKHFSNPLHPIRVLRNRVAHHEPVHHWDLPRHHNNILQVTEWLYPPAAVWSRYHSNFDAVWEARDMLKV
jgi:abortive infection bacteriophage resistance protein